MHNLVLFLKHKAKSPDTRGQGLKKEKMKTVVHLQNSDVTNVDKLYHSRTVLFSCKEKKKSKNGPNAMEDNTEPRNLKENKWSQWMLLPVH